MRMKEWRKPELSENALEVLNERYLLRGSDGKIVESPEGLFARVAEAVAKVDGFYDDGADVFGLGEEFYEMLASLDFLPNSPTLMNAKTELGQLSACFVLPVEDSMEDIFEAVKNMALIHKSGGGTGFSFSKIRPKGDLVSKTHGLASGPLSFMRVFDVTTDVIKQGGKRRGANMAALSVDHPDIFDFITAKAEGEGLANFNLSVAVSDEFMEAASRDDDFSLVNPRNKQVVKRVKARRLFDAMVRAAHTSGDPGMIFIDEINRHNQILKIGKIEATNPCGEQPLLPFESCNLGSINLARMVKGGKIDRSKLKVTIGRAVHFLDNVIDASRFPLPEIEKITRANRKIGLGVMGFADMLILLGVSYSSAKALEVAEEVMTFISKEAREKSIDLAKRRGSFPNFKESRWAEAGFEAMRNATVTTIAPTGSISLIAGVSSGIEPLFALSFYRDVLTRDGLVEISPLFKEKAEAMRLGGEVMKEVIKTGSAQKIEGLDPDIKRLFLTALEIPFEQHVRIQAAFQKHTDNAVSKTVNLPESASFDDVASVFLLAYELGCKGATIYRYGSKESQVLYTGQSEFKNERAASIKNKESCSDCKT